MYNLCREAYTMVKEMIGGHRSPVVICQRLLKQIIATLLQRMSDPSRSE